MKSLFLVCVVLIHCSWSYGSPGQQAAGAFAYVDTSGNRYECVYKPKYGPDSSKVSKLNEVTSYDTDWQFKRYLPPLPPLPPLEPLHPLRPFRPFKPFRRIVPLAPLAPIRDIFGNIENQQRAAFEAAHGSFDTFNAFPFIPNFGFRYPSYDFNYFGSNAKAPFGMSSANSAFASAALGPGYRRQVAAINPANQHMPNVDTSSVYPHASNPLGKDFYSVSSSSYSSSVNDNGQLKNQRGAETVVNDRGHVTKYSVHN